jgi:pyridinium-3,5-biscarboxylic acid mononucleotide sulfurtransferase
MNRASPKDHAFNDALSRYQDLLENLRAHAKHGDGLVIAYSGGVDSAFLLAASVEALSDFPKLTVTALTAISASYPEWERQPARDLAQELGVQHLELETAELQNPKYRANAGDRCFHCKSALFDVAEWARPLAQYQLKGTLIYGAIVDDQGDHRPGMMAAQERGVMAPLIEANLDKVSIRQLSRFFGLPTWDKPASACLSSRFPYGIEVTSERLEQVGICESRLHSLGLKIVRARFHDSLVRLEFGATELEQVLVDPDLRTAIIQECKAVGFKFVSIDLEGYRSGSANEALVVIQ